MYRLSVGSLHHMAELENRKRNQRASEAEHTIWPLKKGVLTSDPGDARSVGGPDTHTRRATTQTHSQLRREWPGPAPRHSRVLLHTEAPCAA